MQIDPDFVGFEFPQFDFIVCWSCVVQNPKILQDAVAEATGKDDSATFLQVAIKDFAIRKSDPVVHLLNCTLMECGKPLVVDHEDKDGTRAMSAHEEQEGAKDGALPYEVVQIVKKARGILLSRSSRHAGSEDGATSSAASIDYRELEAFRRSLPEYRRYESYSFFTASWDIVLALYLIHKRPRALQTIDVAQFARQYGFPFIEDGGASAALPEDSGFFYVDTKTVMSEQIDLERPVILALIEVEGRERPSALLIDGLHRLYKAARRGLPKLQAYVLTPEEEHLCRR